MAPLEVFWNPDGLLHDTGMGVMDADGLDHLIAVPELHFENAERVRNMRAALELGPLRDRVRFRDGRLATEDELRLVHTPGHVERIREACAASAPAAAHTPTVPASWPAALRSVGCAIEAVDAAMAGVPAYALVRPPGHHAQPDRADGYCLFSNTAIAAEHARRVHGVERVAVLDWDVHHGNGTQACFFDRADVLTISWHMRHGSWGESHPQTGSAFEIGEGAGRGFNVNFNLRFGTGDIGYLAAFERVVAPLLRAYRPDLILVASGQDASSYDPNGRMNLTMRGFRALGAATRALADELCGGRLALVQEGGYARTYAALCLLATVEGVLGEEGSLPDPGAAYPDDPGIADGPLRDTVQALSLFWPGLR